MAEATIIRRRRRPLAGRRPFLAPLVIMALLAVGALAAVAIGLVRYTSAATTTVVVVRSGESASGDLQDPPLVAAGEQRAERLAQLFGGRGSPGRIEAIYVTAARRVQQMAMPLAARLGIRPVVISNGDADEAAGRALNEHRGATVMVVTSATTLPRLIEALSGIKLAPPARDQYGEIYIVSVPALGSAGVVKLQY
jgi:2,3-bisphosphoglycerate-dependent phosphoglycerate mutase